LASTAYGIGPSAEKWQIASPPRSRPPHVEGSNLDASIGQHHPERPMKPGLSLFVTYSKCGEIRH
jgi:hypothetical protein